MWNDVVRTVDPIFAFMVVPVGSAEATGAAMSGAPVDDVDAGRRRVLVVDDNVDAAETMRLLLEWGGHEVSVAYDGDAAVLVAARFRPHVVLCDIGLPGISGHEVARRMRKLPCGTEMILVAVTGFGQDRDKANSSAAGFDYHFVKPMDLTVLAPILANAGG